MQECSVCLEQKSKKKFKIIDCGHCVCFECYNKLLSYKHHNCPICRFNFKSNVENNFFYKIRKRRRNLTFEEYNKRKERIKLEYKKRKKKQNSRFYKSSGTILS